MKEKPYDRYFRRQAEVEALEQSVEAKKQEIEDELEAAQKACSPHIDDGGMFYGSCTKCGLLFD